MKSVFLFAVFGGVILGSIAGPALAQSAPNASPSPSGDPVSFVSRHHAASGIEIKNLASPKESQNLKWQKIIVGQEALDGATLVGLSKSSVWRRLGFRSGDIIVRINGKDLHSSEDLDKALDGLKKEHNSTIDFRVIRENQKMILNYQISW